MSGELVIYQYRCKFDGNNTGWSPWKTCTKDQASDYKNTPILHTWLYEVRELYSNAPENITYEAWISIDNCNEFYSWEECGKDTYDANYPVNVRRIIVLEGK